MDIAALLIKHNTNVNATDRWGFTPLHEAAQKGRTQLCALLLAHGANPTMINYEGQTALDLATAEDVKCLLMDAQLEPPLYSTSLGNGTVALPKSNINSGIINSPSINNGLLLSEQSDSKQIQNDELISNNSTAILNNFPHFDLIQQLIREMTISIDSAIGSVPNSSVTNLTQSSALLSKLNEMNSNEIVPSSLALLLSQRNADNVNGERCPENKGNTTNTTSCSGTGFDLGDLSETSLNNLNTPPQTGDGQSCPVNFNNQTNSTSINESTSTTTSITVSNQNNQPNTNSKLTNYLPVSSIPTTVTVPMFLNSLGLDFLIQTLMREHITIDILAEMGHEELKTIGVSAYGHRHRILKGLKLFQ